MDTNKEKIDQTPADILLLAQVNKAGSNSKEHPTLSDAFLSKNNTKCCIFKAKKKIFKVKYKFTYSIYS